MAVFLSSISLSAHDADSFVIVDAEDNCASTPTLIAAVASGPRGRQFHPLFQLQQ